MGNLGFEPRTSRVSDECSNLTELITLMDHVGLEPTTSCV